MRSEAGDCDDYAILADRVLRPKGYGTRLVCVRMPGLIAHDVCYVGEEKGYLDYNNRVYWIKIERSGPSLREIATKVAKSFSANWTSASEFTYPDDCLKHLIHTISKTDFRKRLGHIAGQGESRRSREHTFEKSAAADRNVECLHLRNVCFRFRGKFATIKIKRLKVELKE